MARIAIIFLMGLGVCIFIGIIVVFALIINRNFVAVTDQAPQIVTPVILVTETAVADKTLMPPVEPTESATLPVVSVTPTITVVVSTDADVLRTQVEFIIAQQNANLRDGPDTRYDIVGLFSEGQTAQVTGISRDKAWWRVTCPDDIRGNCWITANEEYTQPTSEAEGLCSDKLTFVTDVTIPDETVIAPETEFDKTWRLKNSGTCTWTTDYQLIHVGGDLLDAVSDAFPLPEAVAPGETIELTIRMVSPATPGTYQSDWKLQNAQGTVFGLELRRTTPIWVKIEVAELEE